MAESSRSDRLLSGRFSGGRSKLLDAINVSIDFDKRLWKQDIRGSLAHCDMLAEQGIISSTDAASIAKGLQAIQIEIADGEFDFKSDLEDIHMNIEGRLREMIGPVAGRLHTARSRNDQVATDFRLWTRASCSVIDSQIRQLMTALLDQAAAGADMVMPGFTHLQVAQPITWGHHMMAYVEMFGRDLTRFADAAKRMNESPLGAAALAGTSFPIDRFRTAKALDFDRPMANSIDAVSDRDFVIEYLSAASITAVHLSRLAEEVVLWCSDLVSFVQIGDSFTTGSSIMPQKRNPDAAELIRAKTGRISGSLVALLTILKALPLAYSKDLQEDKEQLFDVADNLELSLAAMEGLLREMTPDISRLSDAAGSGYSTATDLADWLVREAGFPFRESHEVVSGLVRLAHDRGLTLSELTMDELQAACPAITAAAREILDPRKSVMSRTSYGGTAPERVREQIQAWKEKLACERD
ncbi:MAG: argininosuccinate lyase [Rhodobacteraceae bacterium]|nr:argininosuccinate lyase [Paracoccaceae bacterium]